MCVCARALGYLLNLYFIEVYDVFVFFNSIRAYSRLCTAFASRCALNVLFIIIIIIIITISILLVLLLVLL